MLASVLHTVIIYAVVIFAMRLMGKRQLGELQPAELALMSRICRCFPAWCQFY